MAIIESAWSNEVSGVVSGSDAYLLVLIGSAGVTGGTVVRYSVADIVAATGMISGDVVATGVAVASIIRYSRVIYSKNRQSIFTLNGNTAYEHDAVSGVSKGSISLPSSNAAPSGICWREQGQEWLLGQTSGVTRCDADGSNAGSWGTGTTHHRAMAFDTFHDKLFVLHYDDAGRLYLYDGETGGAASKAMDSAPSRYTAATNGSAQSSRFASSHSSGCDFFEVASDTHQRLQVSSGRQPGAWLDDHVVIGHTSNLYRFNADGTGQMLFSSLGANIHHIDVVEW